MSYQQCTGFRTTAHFDRECLWKGSSNQQSINQSNVVVSALSTAVRPIVYYSVYMISETNMSLELCEKPGQNEGS